MSVDEALCWLAHDKPSHDIEVHRNAAGALVLMQPNGNPITSASEGTYSIDRSRAGSRKLHAALRDGSLFGYILPENGYPLAVPRLYWNNVHQENLDPVYRGTSQSNMGMGCAVLVARVAFDEWREGLAIDPTPETPLPSHNDVVEWCERWIRDGHGNGMDKAWSSFKNDSKHHGLSRDNAFRPAWRDAKTQINKDLS